MTGMRSALRVACAIASATVPVLFAEQQPRDGRTPAVTGTGVIAGVVVTDEGAAQPVRKAIVTISGPALPNSRTTITDAAGKFAIDELPEGRFTITAKKAAYIPGAYGATRPGRPGTPLALAAGQRADVTLEIARAAVLAGAIRDQQGEPVPGVQVGALKIPGSGAVANIFSTADMTTTDDRGVYRLFGLLPGEYVVAAVPRVTGSGEIGSRSAAEMDATLLALQRRSGRGGSAPLPGGPPVSQLPSPSSFSYAPTYFPGSTVFAGATRIRLGPGDERAGVDFIVSPVPSGIIEGSITGAGDTPGSVQLAIQIDGPRMPGLSTSQPVLSVKPGATNQFRYTNVAPGRYRIMARLARGEAPPPVTGAVISGGGVSGNRPPNSPDTLYAVTDLDTTGSDITGVVLFLQPGANVSGRSVFESSSRQPPGDLSGIRVTISPSGGTYMSSSGGTVIGNTFQSVTPAQLRPDGAFTATGIAPGTYQLRVTIPAGLSQAWVLESALSRGKDLLDVPVDIEAGGDLSDVILTFSDRRSELAGMLQTSTGAPAPEYFVMAFSSDRTYWTPLSRRLKSVRPGTDGRFAITDLPAGDYLIAALTDVDPDEWQTPTFLEQLIPASIKVVIAPGARVTQDIRVVR